MNIVDLLDELGRTYRFHNVDKLSDMEQMTTTEKKGVMESVMRKCKDSYPDGWMGTIGDKYGLVITAKKTRSGHPLWNIYFD